MSAAGDWLEDYFLNLVLIQEDAAIGQGGDDHTIKGGRILRITDVRDLFFKFLYDSTPLFKYIPCASNIAING
jgi:hypothetical protein